MNLFLKAKHWQLFILTIVLPIVFFFFAMFQLLMTIIPLIENQSDSLDLNFIQEIINQFSWMVLPSIILIFFMYVWQWSVVINLQKKIPEKLRINTTIFKFTFFIPILTTILSIIGLYMFTEYLFQDGFNIENFDPTEINRAVSLLNLLNLAFMGVAFYNMYLTAKTIKLAEVKKEVTIGDFAVEMFFIWFFFIGVWILQPRINKIINDELEDEKNNIEDNLIL